MMVYGPVGSTLEWLEGILNIPVGTQWELSPPERRALVIPEGVPVLFTVGRSAFGLAAAITRSIHCLISPFYETCSRAWGVRASRTHTRACVWVLVHSKSDRSDGIWYLPEMERMQVPWCYHLAFQCMHLVTCKHWSEGFPDSSDSKESACNLDVHVQSLVREDPLEKGMATHSSILAWRIPLGRGAWTWRASVWGHRVRHDWVTNKHWPDSLSAGGVALLMTEITAPALHCFLSCTLALLFQRPTGRLSFQSCTVKTKPHSGSSQKCRTWSWFAHWITRATFPAFWTSQGCRLDPASLHTRGCVYGLNFKAKSYRNVSCGPLWGHSYLRPCVVQSYISGHVVTTAKSSPVIYPLLCPLSPLSHPSLAVLCLENRPAASPTARPSSPNTARAESLLDSET